MILLYIYLTISIVTLLQFLFMIIDASMKLKKLYPNIIYEKTSFGENLGVWFRIILFSFIPIINIIVSITFLFNYDDCMESIISKVHNKYKDQIDKEN
jgi:dolichol kinase